MTRKIPSNQGVQLKLKNDWNSNSLMVLQNSCYLWRLLKNAFLSGLWGQKFTRTGILIAWYNLYCCFLINVYDESNQFDLIDPKCKNLFCWKAHMDCISSLRTFAYWTPLTIPAINIWIEHTKSKEGKEIRMDFACANPIDQIGPRDMYPRKQLNFLSVL